MAKQTSIFVRRELKSSGQDYRFTEADISVIVQLLDKYKPDVTNQIIESDKDNYSGIMSTHFNNND